MSEATAKPNPYAAPRAEVRDADGPAGAAPALWNPNAAANWSLIFTPAFGAYLHMLNWRALQEPKRAAAAKAWFVVGLVMLGVYVLIGVAVAEARAADGASRALALLFLIIWYYAAARGQARYVKERWGKDYPRRGWGKPLLIGVAAYAGFIAVAFAAGFLLAMVQGGLR